MQHLKEFQQNTVADLLNVALLRKLLELDVSSSNRAEVPALVAWTLSIVFSPGMERCIFLRGNSIPLSLSCVCMCTHTHTHTHTE